MPLVISKLIPEILIKSNIGFLIDIGLMSDMTKPKKNNTHLHYIY